MKRKTNFDQYLGAQLKDEGFAERFKKAGEAWDVASTAQVADDADLEEVYNTERHLLYVACTWANHLLVTGVDPASEFLDDLRREDQSIKAR
jgi:hypothetical protein